MPVLLTGGTGLVGPELLRRLLARGDRVRVLALPETIDALPGDRNLEIVEGDLLDPEVVASAVDGVDVVYRLAARLLGAPARDLIRVNVHGTENLLRACAAHEVTRFLLASSSRCSRRRRSRTCGRSLRNPRCRPMAANNCGTTGRARSKRSSWSGVTAGGTESNTSS